MDYKYKKNKYLILESVGQLPSLLMTKDKWVKSEILEKIEVEKYTLLTIKATYETGDEIVRVAVERDSVIIDFNNQRWKLFKDEKSLKDYYTKEYGEIIGFKIISENRFDGYTFNIIAIRFKNYLRNKKFKISYKIRYGEKDGN